MGNVGMYSVLWANGVLCMGGGEDNGDSGVLLIANGKK